MLVKLKSERRLKLNSVSTKTYPAGWSGQVDDTVAERWVAEGAAEPVITEASVLAEITAAVKAEAVAKSSTSSADDISLDTLSVNELRQVAASAGLDGASKMKKAELLAALKALQAEPEA